MELIIVISDFLKVFMHFLPTDEIDENKFK
jgi:hypothetical protein